MKPELTDLIPSTEPPLPMAAEAEKTVLSTSDESVIQNTTASEDIKQWKPGRRLWAIVGSLAFLNMVGGLENTITVVALPTIVADIKGGSNYVWISDIQFITGAAILPFLGQLANIFGRRYCTLGIVLVYTLGSTLCAVAQNMDMLLAGRAIQGAGTQGTLMMTEIIIADLVPVRWRASYTSIILAVGGIASLAGPSLGGVICQYTTWRWCFYLNLPICGISLALLFIFLRVRWNRDESIAAKLRRIDWIGNFIVLASSIITLLALIWAGVVYPWKSAQVLVPLMLGLLGLVGFVFYEALAPIPEPVLPIHILRSPTPIILFVMTFFFNMNLYYVSFYMTIYYQGVLAKTPAWASLLMLPVSLLAVPAIVICTAILGKTGRYKWLQVGGFALTALGLGLMSLVEPGDSAAKYICVQIPAGLAVGGLVGTLLPAFQGCAPEKDQAAATAGWTWIRSFSMVWGVAIAGTIFNQYILKYVGTIEDANVRQLFRDGDAFSLATKEFVESYQDPVRSQIQWVLDWAYQKILQIGVTWAGIGLIAALFAKEIKMRSALETEYGLEEEEKRRSGEPDAAVRA